MDLTTTSHAVGHLALLPERRAALDPDGPCIDDDRVALTNAEFAARVRAAAEVFEDLGVSAGGVVATLLSNRVELVVCMFAAWRVGAALTPVNPALTAPEARFQIEDAGARLVVHEGTAPGIDGVALMDAADLPAVPVGDRPRRGGDLDELALLIYTSGTTGKPKGVMLDHSNLTSMAGMIVDALELSASDRCLLILPLFHVNGILVSVLSPLAVGGCTTITGRFSPSTFFDTVEAVRPTYFSAVPTILAMLAALPDDVAPDTSSIRFAVCGAAPMPAGLISDFESRFGILVIEGYGLSEGCCASTINPIHGPRRPGTVGRPVAGQQVALIDPDGQPTATGPGEVIIRGPNVMRGYLNRPDETARALAGGWLHTGDVGRFEDGYLVLVDRVKDMIIRGGENIYPKEIESVLYEHPAVLEAAVVGRPHDVMGEEPVAFVALREPAAANVDELLAWCAGSLARFKVPRSITILDALPKNAISKIDKPALRALLAPGGSFSQAVEPASP